MSSPLYWQEKGKQRQAGQPILFLPLLSYIFSCLLNIGTCSTSNSDSEDSVPYDKTQQLLRKHLMTPFKYTVACSLFDTVSKYVLYSVRRQIQTELETESHLSPGLSTKPVAFISKSGRPGPHAFVPRVPSPQAARGACS